MAVTSYKFPGTLASETIGGGNATDWTNPSNAGADDTSEASWSVSTASADQGPYLKATNFGFTSSDIPNGSTINGFEVEYRRREGSSTDDLTTNRCRIIKAGSIHTANVSTMNTVEWVNAASETGSENITEGGAANLWGLTWLATDIVGVATFGVAIAPNGAGTTPDAFIDYIKLRVYYTAPAGATLTADTGAFTLTGIAATLSRTRKLLTATGAFSLTGVAALLKASRKLPTSTGAFTLTGNDAALSRTRKLVTSTGSFTLTGINTVLAAGRKLAVGAGAFTLTGNAAALSRTRKLLTSAGAFALTGNDVTLTYSAATPSTGDGFYFILHG